LKKRFQKAYGNFIEEVKFAVRKSLLLSVPTTAAVWIWYALTCFLEAKCFGVSVPLSYLLLVYTAGSLITALPISVAGLGTRDLTFIYLFSLRGISPETALILSIFSYILNPILSMFLLYAASTLAYAFRRSDGTQLHG